jgi:CTP:molybdopterin cytidylyltransferase MocA/NifU-like protein involved in Fe-S cluster formation
VTPRIAAVVLSAGASKRMGDANKLLAAVNGKPLAAWAVDAALASRADPVVVVTGHQGDAVRRMLRDRPLTFVHNPDFAAGLSTSLGAGIAALDDDIAGALVCLADMPRVTAGHMDRLIDAFDADAIGIPVFDGRRGNPVLLPRRFFAEIKTIEGDVGARRLIAHHAGAVRPVAMDDDGVLVDVDTAADIGTTSDDRHEAIPYPVDILELADARAGHGRLADADATATADNPYCGDRVTMDVKVQGGVLVAMAHRVRGCILCEAAATVAARHAVGETSPALRQTTDALRDMLSGDVAPPGGPWNDLGAFLPVRPHKSRHACVLLPFEALIEAMTGPPGK